MLTLSVRGAVGIRENCSEAIEQAVTILMETIEKENGLSESDLTLILFSVTADVTAINPAAALRRSGRYQTTPLFCTQEPVYEGSLPLTVRVLVQFCAEEKRSLRPVYLGSAAVLRPEWAAEEK